MIQKIDNSLLVDIHISEDEYLRHYQGSVSNVSAVARDGRRIRFPSRILQPFVRQNGIHGTFSITFDNNHKFVDINQIS